MGMDADADVKVFFADVFYEVFVGAWRLEKLWDTRH